jgi:hypothetical protein
MPSAVVMPEIKGMVCLLIFTFYYNNFADFLCLQYISVISNEGETNSSLTKLKSSIDQLLNNPVYIIVVGAILLLSLFIADSWILGNAPDSENTALYAILLGIFIMFSVEMIVMSYATKGYFMSAFFWLDVLGTFSIILDIAWIANGFIPQSSGASQGSLVRSTRAARLASRYGRLLRLLRLGRILKTLPCFLMFSSEDDFEPTMAAIKKVSEELSNSLQLRLAVLILLLVIVVPFMSYTVTDYSPQAWITVFKMNAKNESISSYELNELARKCSNFFRPKKQNLLSIYVETPWLNYTLDQSFHTRDVLRSSNTLTYDGFYYVSNSILNGSGNAMASYYLDVADVQNRNSRTGYTKFKVSLELDETDPNRQSSTFSILIIILVLVCLFGFSSMFNSLVNNLVVKPLEKMMMTLRHSAMIMIDSLKQLENHGNENTKDGKAAVEEDDEELETAKLEKMVEKLGRIISHILPGSEDITVGGNIDKGMADWLKQSYAAGATVRKDIVRTESVMAHEAGADQGLLKSLESKLSNEVRETINSWYFDVLSFSREELMDVILYLFSTLNLLQDFKVPELVFRNFIDNIFSRYIDSNSYHNFRHGCDVCFTSYRLVIIPRLTALFTPLEVYSLLVSALAHDVGHIGLNNAFLIKAKHELALRHNDKSPLENMHCVLLYEILTKAECNIFQSFDDSQWRESRKIIIFIILGTDMQNHPQQIKDAKVSTIIIIFVCYLIALSYV